MNTESIGVSFVVPVLNGRRWLRAAIESIVAQQDGRPFEIIAVDDGSTDGSLRVLRQWARAGRLRLIHGRQLGAAAAINTGIGEARHPIICQVDQDVILCPGWLTPLLGALRDPETAAAQGQYVTASDAGFWARAMGRDLEHRYAGIRDRLVDHVCTGNTAYRATALHQVGLLDEQLGYGYDNDLSYRLSTKGYRLAFCRDSISVHRWREGFHGYLSQQFGVGYGRLDVLARHPGRVGGDDVSGTVMMLHGPAMLLALSVLASGILAFAPAALILGLAIIAGLGAERMVAGVVACRRTGDAAALGFVAAHLVRDVAWAAAIVIWLYRCVRRLDGRPGHSMWRSKPAAAQSLEHSRAVDGVAAPRVLAIVPAFNESATLPRVVAELRQAAPRCDLLVVNDGSTDSTSALLPELPVRWMTLSQRVGVGGAVRAGIRYAIREGYDYVVRVDADGQHRPRDIARLLAPVLSGHADAAMGSRFLRRAAGGRGIRRASQALLAAFLTVLTGRRVTDPTSGFWLFGRRALALLARHHPTGYGEPELVLLLSRNGLRVMEIPIRMRPRLAGRTSLTPSRAVTALARTLLALLVVPLRKVVEGQAGD